MNAIQIGAVIVLALLVFALLAWLYVTLDRLDRLRRENRDLVLWLKSSRETSVEFARWVVASKASGVPVHDVTAARASATIAAYGNDGS